MNKYNNTTSEVEIDLIDLMWKLLMQWKAILIACIFMALLVPGAKYMKDSNVYKAAVEEKAKLEAEASRPADERIEEALAPLNENDRGAVQLLLQQEDMVALQQDYLNNSIGLNVDPTSQRTLTIIYLIKSGDSTNMQTIMDTYGTCIHRKEYITKLREIIDPDSKEEFIDELISTYASDVPDSYATSAIFTVQVILPEDVNADELVSYFDSVMKNLHKEIAAEVGDHTVKIENVEDGHIYNNDLVSRRTDIINTIQDLNNRIKSAKDGFTEEQKAAITAIEAIKNPDSAVSAAISASADETEELVAPSFSIKYALLGFVLGAVLYAGVYMVLLILKRVISSASTVQTFTNTRLLGEVYSASERKGIRKLLTSVAVLKLRYGKKLNKEAQADEIAATVDSVCSYNDTKKLTLLLSGIGDGLKDTVDLLLERCRAAGSGKEFVAIDADTMEEKELSSVSDAVYVVSSNSKLNDLTKLIGLCKDYGIRPLGSVYMEEM